MSNNMIWHPASELPQMHETSFEDDGMIFKSMLSDWVLVRDDSCADTLDDPYNAPVRVSRFCRDSSGDLWDDCTGRRSTVTHWMPLPPLLTKAQHNRDTYQRHTVICQQCGVKMHNVSKNRKYCPECAKANQRERARQYQHKARAALKQPKPKKSVQERDAEFVAENARLEAIGGSYGKGRLKEYLAAQNKKPSGAGNTGEPAKG